MGDTNVRLKELFARLEPLSTAERDAIFADELADEPAMRAALESLLDASDETDNGLFTPFVESPDRADKPPGVPDRIGPYRVVSMLGRGGMACVYRAVQERPMRREVALKVVRPGFDTESVLGRFESERQALARLQHRNIATVLDAGADPYGPSWFSMALVDGPSITAYCREQALEFRDRLKLFVQVCRGVQHAHTRGILHRDLKPSNILVTIEDGEPVPKIIDFGVAKALGADSPIGDRQHTLETQIVGTLEYMSPEQARFGNPDVDARSDVYALGVILFEMLTGRVPIGGREFTGVALDRVQHLIQTKRPEQPSVITTIDAPHEFDCVVLKALEKEPSNRYESAKEFADDIERFLIGEPLAIRPPTRFYLAKQFARRHRTPVLFTCAIVAAVMLGLIGTTAGLLKALHRGNELEAALERVRESDQRVKRLADFQSARLGDTDVAAMGLVLRDGLLEVLPEEARARLDPAVAGADFAEVARRGIAEAILQDAVRAAEAEFRDEPRLLASVLQDAAEAASNLGLHAVALPLQERALEIWETGGPADEELVLAHASLAIILNGLGRLDEAVEAGDSAQALAAEHHDPADRVSLNVDEMIAGLRRRQGDYVEAERIYRSILERLELTPDLDPNLRIRTMSMLGSALENQSKYEEAERIGQEAYSLRRDTLGPDHYRTAVSLHQYAQALYRLDRIEEAEPALRESAEKLARALGSRHPFSLAAQGGVSTFLHATGRRDEAIEISRRVLAIRQEAYGYEHPATIRSLANLGGMLALSGHPEEGGVMAEQAYDVRVKQLGPMHPETLMSANTIGMAASASKDYERAERFYRIAYEGRREVLGPDHLGTLSSMRNVAGQLVSMGRAEQAEPLTEELVARGEATLNGHWHIAAFKIERARARMVLAKFEESEADLLDAHSVLSARFDPENRFVELARSNLVKLYETWDEAEPGVGHAETAEAWRQRDPSSESPDEPADKPANGSTRG